MGMCSTVFNGGTSLAKGSMTWFHVVVKSSWRNGLIMEASVAVGLVVASLSILLENVRVDS